jgi:hypothetical protein
VQLCTPAHNSTQLYNNKIAIFNYNFVVDDDQCMIIIVHDTIINTVYSCSSTILILSVAAAAAAGAPSCTWLIFCAIHLSV